MPVATELGTLLTDLVSQFFSSGIVQAVLRGSLVALTMLWMAATWWAFRDAARRTGSTLASFLAMAAIVLGGPLLCPLMIVAYLFLRPTHTIVEREERAIAIEALEDAVDRRRCPACNEVVDEAWRRCPACATWLLEDCARCARPVEPSWEICPWCACQPAGRPGAGRTGRGGATHMGVASGGQVPVTALQRDRGLGGTALQRAAAMIRVAARSSGTRRATRTTGGR